MINNRTIKDQCYRNFPVKDIKLKQILFLQIVNKHLLSSSPLLKCIRRPFFTYLKNVHNTYYQVIAASNISITTIKTESFKKSHWWQSEQIWGYNERLLMHSPKWLDISKARHVFICSWCHTWIEIYLNKKWWWKYFNLFRKSSWLCLTWWRELHN